MEITNRQMLEAVDGLNELSELALPVKTAFKLSKITRNLHGILEAYNATLKQLQEKHAERDENGQQVVYQDGEITRIQLKDVKVFNQEYEELMDQESVIEITPLSIDELGDIELKSSTLFKTSWLFLD